MTAVGASIGHRRPLELEVAPPLALEVARQPRPLALEMSHKLLSLEMRHKATPFLSFSQGKR